MCQEGKYWCFWLSEENNSRTVGTKSQNTLQICDSQKLSLRNSWLGKDGMVAIPPLAGDGIAHTFSKIFRLTVRTNPDRFYGGLSSESFQSGSWEGTPQQ